MPAIPQGTLIAGKYRIIDEIGRGGMGIVYKAEDTKLKRTVALKFLPHQWTADAATRERFVHEAQAASALDHPNICTIYEIEETEDGRMYIAMAFYEGESLRERIRRKPLIFHEAVALASQIAQGMAKAHQKGIIHRDIKPANILITTDGVAKVVDFGLAKLAGQMKLTREGTTVGTVAYMSPEQARGSTVDQRTDIWSLGVVLYEMLAGQLPFKGEFEQPLIHSILKNEPEPITKFRKDLPAGLPQIIDKAFAKNPSSRYQTMDELFEDLNAIAEGLKPLRAKMGLFQGRILGIKKPYALAAFSTASILAALVLLFLFPIRGRIYDSIAVLPLVNDSGNPEQDYIANSLTGELIQELYKISSLRYVVDRQTIMAYQKSPKSLKQIAEELKVKTVVQGSVLTSGNQIQLIVSLHDPAENHRLWSDTIIRDFSEIIFLKKEFAREVFKGIKGTVSPAEKLLLTGGRRINWQAYDLYYRGLNTYFSGDWGLKSAMIAVDYLKQAVKLDPDLAQAFAVMGGIYNDLGANGLMPETEAFGEARKAVLRALELDDTLAGAHGTLGDIRWLQDWDFAGAEQEMNRALELEPANSLEQWGYNTFLNSVGRFEEAILREKALEDSAPGILNKLAFFYLCAGRYVEGLDEAIKAADKNPGLWNDFWLVLAYEANGNYLEALSLIDKIMANTAAANNPYYPSAQARILALCGKRDEALEAIEELKKSLIGKNIDPSVHLASIYVALGDKDKALEYLDEAYKKHTSLILIIRTLPMLHALHGDPRYQELLKKIGFDK